MNDKYISVSQLTRYIKYKIDNDVNLNEVFLKGEISNFKAHSRGHFYFTLKDEGSRINAIMFASQTKKIKFVPQDGMKVLVTGKISVFEANGGYQIYVNEMLEDGVGNLYIAYEQLKKKLENEGLFNKDHKKEIPHIPKRVGVVTAPTGAAIKDIISTIKRRWPLTEIYLFPSLVQGEDAKEDIVKQIKKAENFYLPLDTLIVGRGGGSIEDLWPFNEEIVARAIYECKVPTISAVGHEIDFTIADFVADLRAPTPTGAAEMAVPQLSDMKNYLNQVNIRLNNTINNKINNNKRKLNDIMARNIFKNPMIIYEKKELYFDSILERLKFSLKSLTSAKEKELIKVKNSYILKNPHQLLEKKGNKYLQLVSKLETLSPLLTLQRGYTMTKKEGKVITKSTDVKKKDIIEIVFSDGSVNAEIK
ncbi:MAG: exodeoxyribonuclease VII large subunit [Bacilli bacterium]|nr:exodeoxyribonuclease VII large subunit [Bacilli bacterium]